MTTRIVVTPPAGRDLDEQFLYIAQSSSDAAVRYFRAAEATFNQLAASPHLGGVVEFRNAQLTGLRVWRIRGFEKHLIFYRLIEHGIEVVRVLHGARDIEAVFGDELLPSERA